ncbi:MAG: hypothetical protein ACOH5I_13250 [Oligoflexus sp.]
MDEKLQSFQFNQNEALSFSQTRRRLAWSFARVFDHSYVKSVCQALHQQRRQPGIEFLGDGAHSMTYRLFTGKPMDLAISLAKPGFFSCLSRGTHSWPMLMDQLSRLDHPLIPPFAIIHQSSEWLAFIRPYCPQTVDELPPEIQQNLEGLKKSLIDVLHDKGLMIDDYLQIRAWKQHPFVIDWSDLVLKRRSA